MMKTKEEILEKHGVWVEPENTTVNPTAEYSRLLKAMEEYASQENASLRERIAEMGKAAVSGSLPLPSDSDILKWSEEFSDNTLSQAEFRVHAKFMRACMKESGIDH